MVPFHCQCRCHSLNIMCVFIYLSLPRGGLVALTLYWIRSCVRDMYASPKVGWDVLESVDAVVLLSSCLFLATSHTMHFLP